MKTNARNFAQAFCETYGIADKLFEDAMLSKSLYPHARLLLIPLGKWLRVPCFEAERELLADIGHSEDKDAVSAVLSRMPWYYGQRWRGRNRLRLRISSRRVRAIASKIGLARSRKRSMREKESGAGPEVGGAVPAA